MISHIVVLPEALAVGDCEEGDPAACCQVVDLPFNVHAHLQTTVVKQWVAIEKLPCEIDQTELPYGCPGLFTHSSVEFQRSSLQRTSAGLVDLGGVRQRPYSRRWCTHPGSRTAVDGRRACSAPVVASPHPTRRRSSLARHPIRPL